MVFAVVTMQLRLDHLSVCVTPEQVQCMAPRLTYGVPNPNQVSAPRSARQ